MPVLSKFASLAGLATVTNEAHGAMYTSRVVSSQSLVASLRTKVATKEEIMANMTSAKAANMVMDMAKKENPELYSMIQEQYSNSKKGNLRAAGNVKKHNHNQNHKKQDPAQSGYAGVGDATAMLNKMIKETQTKLEMSQAECFEFNGTTLANLDAIREDITSFNSAAAAARGGVLKAQGAIGTIEVQVPKLKDELMSYRHECYEEETGLKEQLAVVEKDLNTLEIILKHTDCNDPSVATPAQQAAAAAFMQSAGIHGKKNMTLVQCDGCTGHRRVTMLQDPKIQALVGQLKTKEAHEFLQENLGGTFHKAKKTHKAVVLTQQEASDHLNYAVKLATSERGNGISRQDPEGEGTEAESDGDINVTEIPDAVVPMDCAPTDKCVLGQADCTALRDRFLLIQSGIMETQSELKGDLEEVQTKCAHQIGSYEAQIASLEENLRKEQTNLATSTEEQVAAEEGSHVKGKQHADIATDYSTTMHMCCETQNGYRSENCALEKIRGELAKMEGQNVFLIDCELSDWAYEACSVTCGGGGTMKATRSVLTQPQGGAECMPLEMDMPCGEEECPVNCIVTDWSEWSSCSAECGGGVIERVRNIDRPAAHGGDPCGDTSETQPCHVQGCDADCSLHGWTDWEACTAECGGGHEARTREVEEPARGTGTCFEPLAPERLAFRTCNTDPCEDLLTEGRTTLECAAKVDLILLVDGSGSLGPEGWQHSVALTDTIVKSLEGGENGVQIAILLFSGPDTWTKLYSCMGIPGFGEANMEEDCQMKWVTKFSSDFEDVASKVEAMEWPSSSTLTSMALGEAEQMIQHGRSDAQTVTVVITDGKPLSRSKTLAAAHKLQEQSKVIWVPVGSGIPMELIEEMASLPHEDHIVKIDTFEQMSDPKEINKILKATCPHVA